MSVPYKKLDLEPFPQGILTTTIRGKYEVEGKPGERVLQVDGEAVLVCITSEKELLDAEEGVMVIFTGQERMGHFLVNALVSWCAMEGQLPQMIAHLLRKHPEEYMKAQIDALALNLTKEGPHDEPEGSS